MKLKLCVIGLINFLAFTLTSQFSYAAHIDNFNQKNHDSAVLRYVSRVIQPLDGDEYVLTKVEDGGYGTSFLISDQGYFITNHHVIEPTLEIAEFAKKNPRKKIIIDYSLSGGNISNIKYGTLSNVIDSDGVVDLEYAYLVDGNTKLQIKVIKYIALPGKDVAILQVVNWNKVKHRHTPLAITSSSADDLVKGQPIWASGYPSASEELMSKRLSDPLRKDGTVSGFQKIDEMNVHMIEHITDVSPGMSGGPVSDQCGRVVAYTSFGWAPKYFQEKGVNTGGFGTEYAMLASELTAELDALGIKYIYDSTPCKTQVDLTEINTEIDSVNSEINSVNTELSSVNTELTKVYIISASIFFLLLITIIIFWGKIKKKQPLGFTKVFKRMAELSKIVRFHEDKDKNKQAASNAAVKTKYFGLIEGIGSKVKGLSYKLSEHPCVIGRNSEQCDFVINVDTVSSRHVQIGWDELRSQFWIQDIGSSHGTFVEGEKLNERQRLYLENEQQFYLSEPDVEFKLIRDDNV